MLGYGREEMVGRSVFDFVAEEFREEAPLAVAEKIRAGDPARPRKMSSSGPS